MKVVISSSVLALMLATTAAVADDAGETKPACPLVRNINGWAQGNQQIVRLDTAGRHWRVTFREPCLGTDKSLGFRFGQRIGSVCVEPGDELIFETIGHHEHYCVVAKVELMKFGEKLVPDPDAAAPQ